MRKIRFFSAAALMSRIAVLVGLALLPAPALAQYIGGAPPPLPAAPGPGEVQSPAGTLARAVRMLARSPRDFNALITAGRAALDLGDIQAAIGFYGRAEEVRPSDPAPKIGMGAATVITGDADGALRWFFEAQRLGATNAALGADRGLAQDLLGNQASAQVDYRAALRGREADEARRRLSLSLGISGDRNGAFSALQPLLMRRDPAAQRIRAFVLALVGDERGASSAIDQAMPGSGLRMAGFFRLLPTLSAPQKAAAVHLGVFPDPSEIRVAAVAPQIVTAPPPIRREPIAAPPAARRTPVVAEPTRLAALAPTTQTTNSSVEDKRPDAAPNATPPVADPTPLPLPPPALASAPVVAPPLEGLSTSTTAAVTSVPLEAPAQGPANPDASPTLSTTASPLAEVADASVPPLANPSDAETRVVAVSSDRLTGIDRLLAQADELPVPPAPRPHFENETKVAAVDPAPAKKVADAKKAADAKKVADSKKAADAKKAAALKKAAEEREERESVGIAGTNWVQLAGGSHADRMGGEFRRLAAKSAALRKRGGAVTEGKDYFRLLTGPFPSKKEAQTFVNQLAKDGVDGFSWTRTPANLKIEKLPPK